MNSETFSLICILKAEVKDSIARKNYNTANKQLRNFITICNSLCIKLLQTKAFTEFNYMMKKALKSDELLFQYGNQSDRFWQGRLITWLIQTYNLLTNQDLINATKVMYKSHCLIEELKQAGGILNTEIKISLNFLSFLVLWRYEKLENSLNFLKITKNAIEAAQKSNKSLKISLPQMEILITMSLSAFMIKTEGNFRHATKRVIEIHEKYKNSDNSCSALLKSFWKDINKECNKSYLSDFNTKDFLITQDFEDKILKVCIEPFISEDCPLIDSENQPRPERKFFHKRISSQDDKNSTNSSTWKSEGDSRSKFSKNQGFKKRFTMIPMVTETRSLKPRVAIYSPTLGLARPRSITRSRNIPLSKRPKSQQRSIFS